MLQVGPGVFSANAISPYKSWHVFRPAVVSGIDALLKARGQDEAKIDFSSVVLRYINSFGPQLTGGRSNSKFLADVFDIHVDFPTAIYKYAKDDGQLSSTVNSTFQLRDGKTLQINAGDANVGGSAAILLDFSITQQNIPANSEAVLKALDDARDILHKMFIELTYPIRDKLEPDGEDA